MIFTELRFVAFLAVVIGVTWTLRDATRRKVWLLVASYSFYALWDWRFLGLLVLSTLVDFVAGRAIAARTEPRARRRWLGLSLALNLGVLATFKYLDFFLGSAEAFLQALGLKVSAPVLALGLPLGISFYTFQTLSYTIDIYRGRLRPTDSLLDMGLFVAFFPQLVAGPIVRARMFLPQLRRARRAPGGARLRRLGLLFLIGFFKKACVADNLAMLVDPYFASPATHSSLDAWSAMLLFTTQLYCDFSGYSDMAVASAGLLGFRLPRNFDYPYLRPNITVAWRAWHMTMTTWFRDYVYAPLGGSRGGSCARARNVIVTMIIVGLWHGAHGRFLVWGAIHGLALVTHATWARGRAPGGRAAVATSTLVTFLYVCLTMVVFRADDLGTAWTVWSQVLGQGGAASSVFGRGPLLVFAGLALVHVAARARLLTPLLARLPAPAYSALCGLFVALILTTMKTDVRPFVYFEF